MTINTAVQERPQERRRGERALANIVVRMNTPQGLFFGHACNLSLGGACVETDIALPMGTSATIAFRLFDDEEEPLRVPCYVAWVEESNSPLIHRVGFTFEAVSEQVVRDIESFFLQRGRAVAA